MPRFIPNSDVKTTPAVKKSRERKKRNKKKNWEYWRAIANRLNISIIEAKAGVAKAMFRRTREIAIEKAREAAAFRERSRHSYNSYW